MRNSLFAKRKRKEKQKAGIEGAETSAISLLEDDEPGSKIGISAREESKTKDQSKPVPYSDGETSQGGEETGRSRANILWKRLRTTFGFETEEESSDSADCDHALRDTPSHQYQSLAELTRRAQRNNNRLALQASRSSANAVLDRLSCSCFAVAVATVVVVSMVSVATVLISGEEQKQKETKIIVAKIQMNEEPVIVSGSVSEATVMKQAENLNESSTKTILQSSKRNGIHEKNAASGGQVGELIETAESSAKAEPSKEENGVAMSGAAESGALENGVGKNGAVESGALKSNEAGSGKINVAFVEEEQRKAEEEKKKKVEEEEDEEKKDADVSSPKTKELLHEARKMNIPRKVPLGEEAVIERKILPLTPNEDLLLFV